MRAIESALSSFEELIHSLQTTVHDWNGSQFLEQIQDARRECEAIEAAPGDVGLEPTDTELAELLAGLEEPGPEPVTFQVEAGPARFPAHLL